MSCTGLVPPPDGGKCVSGKPQVQGQAEQIATPGENGSHALRQKPQITAMPRHIVAKFKGERANGFRQ
jgi:hypothetical protein